MRQLWIWCICLALACPGISRADSGKLSTFSLNGFKYVQLDDWAKNYNLNFTWTKTAKEAQITSKWSKLEFEVDSKKMVLNGVAVWLSAPIAYRSGMACIATLDLDNAIHPVMFPTRNKSGDKVKTICIDPGHGGKDPGNHNSGGYEKSYTLLLAKELKSQLEAAGFKVVLTRTSDKFVELESRPYVAQKLGADLFVSLHFNGVAGGGAKGAEVYALTPPGAASTNARGEGATAVRFPGNRNDAQNSLLAFYVQRGLVRSTGADDRGLRRARFAVLRTSTMPAILVEGGFMSDATEASKIRSSSHRRIMAKGIADGIKEYKRIAEQ